VKSKTDQAQYLLDSSALIALVRGEPGSETVRAAMGASVVSAVNLTETMAKLIRAGGEPRLVERYLRGLQIEVMPWDEELRGTAGTFAHWHGPTASPLRTGPAWRSRRHLRLAAITSDAAWKRLDIGVRVILFRESKGRDSGTTEEAFFRSAPMAPA